jgi:hypothetical protein
VVLKWQIRASSLRSRIGSDEIGCQLISARSSPENAFELRSGGVFDFDAVSDDGSIVATISTSGSKTSGMKYAVGKILKLRSDMLFLTLVQAERRVIVLSEQDMFDQCEKEVADGRVPEEIEFACGEIPAELRTRLVAARLKASRESVGTIEGEQ